MGVRLKISKNFLPDGETVLSLSETVQRKEKQMRGEIIVDGKKMTTIELVELYLETKNDLTVANQLIDAKQREIEELETELRVKEDLFKIKNAISNEPTEKHSVIPSIEWYECEMKKGLEEISRQKAIINNLIEAIYLLQME